MADTALLQQWPSRCVLFVPLLLRMPLSYCLHVDFTETPT